MSGVVDIKIGEALEALQRQHVDGMKEVTIAQTQVFQGKFLVNHQN